MSKQTRQTGINAAAWFYRQSFAGRIEPDTDLSWLPEGGAGIDRRISRIPDTVPVERWIDDKWVTVQVPNPALRGEK